MCLVPALTRLVVSRLGWLFAAGDERDAEILALRHQVLGSPAPGRAGYPTSRRVVRTKPAASGTATQKMIENVISGR